MTEAKTESFICNTPIKHNGEQYVIDDPIELTDKQAAPLIDANAVHKARVELPGNVTKLQQKSAPDQNDPNRKTEATGGSDEEQLAAEQAAERVEQIKAAIATLEEGNYKHWTKDKKPDASVLSSIVGSKVSAAERDAVWAELSI